MPALPQNPASVDDISTAWFDAAIGDRYGKVTSSRVLEVMHGTATKIYVAVTLRTADGSASERRVWVKTGLEAHSQVDSQEAVYAGEVYYYSHVAGRFTTRSPDCLYAKFEPNTGRSVIVLDDLTPLGVVFSDPLDNMAPESVAKALAMMARYQGESWMNPFVRDDKYLRSGGALKIGDLASWLFSDQNWAEQSARPRFKTVLKPLLDQARWRRAYIALTENWWWSGPYCLSHGDCHVGQSYRLPDGDVRLLDWQCCMAASWGHDFANFMVSALSPADRRECEGDLLKAHLELMREYGGHPPDVDTAWKVYSACVLYGAGSALCKVEMQSEEYCTLISHRHMSAAEDLGTLAVLEGPRILQPA